MMKVLLQGRQTTDEAAEGLLNILNVFRERYGIDCFRDMTLNFNMLDREGDIVDLIDPATAEVYNSFEIDQANELSRKSSHPHLKLVIDNTKSA